MNCYILGDLRQYFKVLYVQKKFLTQFLDNYCDSCYLSSHPEFRKQVAKHILNILTLIEYYIERLAGIPLIHTSNQDCWDDINDYFDHHGRLHPIEEVLYPLQNLLIFGNERPTYDLDTSDDFIFRRMVYNIFDYYRRL